MNQGSEPSNFGENQELLETCNYRGNSVRKGKKN
jgi:hypothetical protein